MVKAVHKFTSGWFMSVELLTLVTLMLLICNIKTVTCAAVTSRGSTGVDKLHHSHNSESHVSALDDTVQGDEKRDYLSSPTIMSAHSDKLLVSQVQLSSPNVNRVTAGRNQESNSAMRLPDFRTTLPYFLNTIPALSHRATRQLEQPATSDQRFIKEDVTSSGTPVTKRKIQTEDKNSKFESRSQSVSRKALNVPPALTDTSEVNSSFMNEKWPFNDSDNISFSNSSTPTNGKVIYKQWGIPLLYKEESNEDSKTFLSSNKLISNIASNTSSFVEYGSHPTGLNELSNGKSEIGRLIRVSNSSDSTQNEWSPRGEHGPNSNVGSEMNDGVITSVSANDLGINTTPNSNTHGAFMSLASTASESDEKLDDVSSSVNKNGVGRETANIFVQKINETGLDNDNNGSITKEISGVVKSTQLVELNDSAVYSEHLRSVVGNQSTRVAGNGVDETGGVIKRVSGVTVLHAETGDHIECELAGGEINGSWVETYGGRSDGNASRAEVGKGINLVPSIDIDSNVVSTNLPLDLVRNVTLTVGVPESDTVSSDRNVDHNVIDTAGLKQGVGPGGPSVVTHGTVNSSRVPGEKHDTLRVFKTRDTELTRLNSDNVSELGLQHRQNSPDFVESVMSSKTDYPNTQQRYFVNDSTKYVENLLVGTSFLHPHSVDSRETLPPSGNNVTLGRQTGSAGGSNGTSVTYLESIELDLTEKSFPEVTAFTSKLLTNRVNEEGTEYLQERSKNVTFIADVFSTSSESQNYTTNHDIQQTFTTPASDKIVLQVTEYYNSSNERYDVFPIRENSDIMTEFNFEVNNTYSFNVSFSTSNFYDNDEGIWSSLTPVLSTPLSPVSGSVSDGNRTSLSDVSTVSLGNGSSLDGEPVWPVKLSAEVAGDVILGGLMMVHEREDIHTCGPIMPQGGIQALETMLYTLDVLNREPKMIPNVTIGAHILDDCDKDTYGLEMAVDFIKGREIDCNSMILL
jgi:hypothetical protein